MDNLILISLCLIAIDLAVLGFIILNGFKKIQKEQRINKFDSQQEKHRLTTIRDLLKRFRDGK